MTALIKYLMGVGAVLLVVAISVATLGKVFLDFSTFAQVPAQELPRWTSERLNGGAEAQYAGRGSLSPIYPATPGKELLGQPIYPIYAKQIKVRQAVRLDKSPTQRYPENQQDHNYPQQRLSYTESWRFPLLPWQPQLHTRIISGRELY
jgi:hypothetical protein